jgi:hypothetical protein
MVLDLEFWGVVTLGFWGPKRPKKSGQYKPLGDLKFLRKP